MTIATYSFPSITITQPIVLLAISHQISYNHVSGKNVTHQDDMFDHLGTVAPIQFPSSVDQIYHHYKVVCVSHYVPMIQK